MSAFLDWAENVISVVPVEWHTCTRGGEAGGDTEGRFPSLERNQTGHRHHLTRRELQNTSWIVMFGNGEKVDEEFELHFFLLLRMPFVHPE